MLITLILLLVILIQFSKFNCEYNKSKWATISLLIICIVLLHINTNKSFIDLGKFGKFV
jgi:hypothetical protein